VIFGAVIIFFFGIILFSFSPVIVFYAQCLTHEFILKIKNNRKK
jgi:hypothetical protein